MYKATVFFLIALPITAVATGFSDSFEQDSTGSNPRGSNSIFDWTDSYLVKVSDERAYSGSKSLAFSFEGSPDLAADAMSEQRFSLDKKYTDLWFRYKLWVPENYFHRAPEGPSNNKGLLMLWGDSYSGYSPTVSLHFERKGSTGESYLYSSWRVNGATAFNFFDPATLSAGGDLANAPVGISMSDRGTWIDWVINVRASTIPVASNDWRSGEGNGVVRVWKNGSLILNISNAHNYYDGSSSDAGGSGDGWNAGYLIGWANSGFNEDTTLNIDDFSMGPTSDSVGFELNKPVLGSVRRVLNE